MGLARTRRKITLEPAYIAVTGRAAATAAKYRGKEKPSSKPSTVHTSIINENRTQIGRAHV